MALLINSKHELFAQAVAKGVNLTKAYISAGYSKANADSNAKRLSGMSGF
jgi:phage terminase small subunit